MVARGSKVLKFIQKITLFRQLLIFQHLKSCKQLSTLSETCLPLICRVHVPELSSWRKIIVSKKRIKKVFRFGPKMYVRKWIKLSYFCCYSHFSQTIGALVAVSPADSPLIAKTVPTFRRRAFSVAAIQFWFHYPVEKILFFILIYDQK